MPDFGAEVEDFVQAQSLVGCLLRNQQIIDQLLVH